MGVEILIDEHSALDLDEPLVPDLDASELDVRDLESLDNGIDVARLEPSVLADDPVRMYLKEIGQVQLLDPDRETWLSSQIAACHLLNTIRQRLAAERGDGDSGPDAADVLAALYAHLLDHWGPPSNGSPPLAWSRRLWTC